MGIPNASRPLCAAARLPPHRSHRLARGVGPITPRNLVALHCLLAPKRPAGRLRKSSCRPPVSRRGGKWLPKVSCSLRGAAGGCGRLTTPERRAAADGMRRPHSMPVVGSGSRASGCGAARVELRLPAGVLALHRLRGQRPAAAGDGGGWESRTGDHLRSLRERSDWAADRLPVRSARLGTQPHPMLEAVALAGLPGGAEGGGSMEGARDHGRHVRGHTLADRKSGDPDRATGEATPDCEVMSLENLANIVQAGLTDDVDVPSTIRPRMPQLLPALERTLPEAGASPVGAVGVSQMGQDGGMQARCTPAADVV